MDTTGYYLLKDHCVLHGTIGAGFCAIISVINSIHSSSDERLSETQIFKKVAEAMQLCVDSFNVTGNVSLLSNRSQIILEDKWTTTLINDISNYNDTGRKTLPKEKGWSKELLEYYLQNLHSTLGIFELYFFVEVPDTNKLVLINTLSPHSLSQDESSKKRITVAQLYLHKDDTDTQAVMSLLNDNDLEGTLRLFDRRLFFDFYSGTRKAKYEAQVIIN